MKSSIIEDFSCIVSQLPLAVFVADEQGRIVYSNHLWLEATGYTDGEIQSIEQMDRLEKDLSDKLGSALQNLFSSRPTESIVFSVTHRVNLKKAHFKLHLSLLQNRYAIFSATDITDQVRLEDILLTKKNQFFSLISSLGDAVFKINSKGDILSIWSNNFSDFFQNDSPQQLSTLSHYIPDQIHGSFSSAIDESILERRPTDFEFSYECSGNVRWYLAKFSPIQAKSTAIEEILVVVREITEEREIRYQIEYKNKLIDQLTSINNGPLLHVIVGDSYKYQFISGNLTSLTGYADKESSSLNWVDIIQQQDKDYVLNNLHELKEDAKLLQKELAYRIVDNFGHVKWVTNYISKTYEEGQVMLVGVILNITEVQLLNNQLKQRDRILTNTSKVAMIGGWEYDVSNKDFNLTEGVYKIHERDKIEFDVLGSTSHYVEEHQPLIRSYLHDLFYNGKHFDEELQLVTGKGEKKWVRSIGSAEWENGKITHIYGILQDIDEKKKKDLVIQENERRFNAAFELAPLGIGLFNTEGHWIKVNPSLCQFFELPKTELIKTPIGKLKLADAFNNPFDWEKIGLTQSNTYQLKKKDHPVEGNVKWGRISLSPVNGVDGSPSYFIIQVVDITETKQYEENLIIAKKEAEKANKIKSDFLSTMTHEIRTPLYGVIGLTNLLLEEVQEPKYKEHLKALKFSSDSLFLLVNDILDFSKIRSGVLSLEQKPFDLKRLAETVEELNFLKSKEGGNTISLHFDETLSDLYIGDELRIGQILNNLVGNAVKFTSNGLIQVNIQKSGQSENTHRIQFSIKDNGIGISEDIQPFIFDQFIQAEAGTSRKYGGTGLGLPIVKGLLDAMDSQIKLSSKLGEGTEISFELLLEKPKPVLNPFLPKNGDKEIKNLKKKTILLVEDNPISMMVAEEYIKRWNGNAIKAIDGEEALRKFVENKNHINLVLMDLQIPILNGYEVAEQIHKLKPEVPVIALTASMEDKDYFGSEKSVMQTYLIKPFIPDDLYQTLHTYLF